MRKRFYSAVACILLFAIVSTAQKKDPVWAADGSGYYSVDRSGIYFTNLPNLEKNKIADAALLTPAGTNKPLAITSIQIAGNGKRFLLYTNAKKVWRYETRGDYWLLDTETKKLVKLGLGRPESSMMFAKFSPDNNKVAFVSENNVYMEDLNTMQQKKLTKDGAGRLINGTFDWVYEEEFGCRDGFRWSPGSESIAFWQIDARNTRNFLMINNTDSIYSYTIPVEYPKVGEDPSYCRIGVVDISSNKTEWMNIPGAANQHYIPRMEWIPGTKQLIIQQLNRRQNESKLMICHTSTGKSETIYTETDNAWIDIKSRWNNDDPTGWEWASDKNDFIWISEKDGWRHAWYLTLSGKEHLVTRGEYDVISLKAIDKEKGYLYFTASPDNATQQYLFRAPLDGKTEAVRVTPADMIGTNAYAIAPGAQVAQHTFSNVATSPQLTWVSLPGHQYLDKKPSVNTNYQNVSFFQVTTSENVTLDGYMVKPRAFNPAKRYPVVFYVYGEPAATTVTDTYMAAGNFLYDGDMSADGYIQISLDNRGTPAPKGAAWRKSIYRKIGQLNVRDQAEAVKKIAEWPWIDKERMAVWGWSGGGSLTLNLLFQYPGLFQTGISIAPVTNLLSYDNIYEERYMGLPAENKEDYKHGSPITHAKNLKGNLLLIHGTGDDNVHYQNTEMLIDELVKYGKQFQLMSYPNRSHSMAEGRGTFQHLSRLYTKFLKSHCEPGAR